MILLLKSTSNDSRMPLPDKLVSVFKERVKEVEDDKDWARAERDLAKLQAGAVAERAQNVCVRASLVE